MVLLVMGGTSFQLVNLLIGLILCVLLITITGFSMGSVENSKGRCIERERQALLDFKMGFQDHENLLASWGSSEDEDCCRWRGIGCDDQTGHVIVLDLRLNVTIDGGTYGGSLGMVYDHTLPGSKMSPSLLQLPYLSYLDLSYNDFSGSIPEFIGSLTKLTYLNLSACSLGGTIPHQLGNLSSLRILDLSMNPGLIADNLKWLLRLSSLRTFDMSVVDSIRDVDWLQSIEKLPSLSTLLLSGIQFPEIIPLSLSPINSSKSLRVLRFKRNSFNSSIFSWLFNVSSTLVELQLSKNQLKGPIPDSFGDMSFLTQLDLSRNEFEGGMPKSLGNLCKLKILDLSWNSNLFRPPHDPLQNNFSGCTRESLEILRLSYSQLSGSLPDITMFSSMRELYLDGNQLEGPFPESLGQFSKLVILNLGGNNLTGSLPESVGHLSSLRVFNISSNSLHGVISDAHLSNLSELQQLDLSFNSFALNFSSTWVPPFQLNTIKLSSCKLGPQFPSWLRTQKSFVDLDISYSGISDAIPDWFWNLSPRLRYLNLSFNHISGKVPNLSLKFDNFPTVDLSSNLFYGPIPPFLSSTVVLDLSKNNFSGPLSFLCTTMDKAMQYLDLSDNLLSGGLPDCWMHLKQLVILNLEKNNFSGELPSSMGSLRGIASLRLRKNSFSQKLPSSLKNCNQLELLDLGENKFSGKIPAWIGEKLTSLIVLRLRSNEFNGNLPLNLCHLRLIQVLDLSSNNISGKIPPCLNNFTAMTQKGSQVGTLSYNYANFYSDWHNNFWVGHFTDYVDNALVMWKGIEREYGKNLGLLKVIDLSSNKLTGEIPREVTSLLELMILNLSRNNLTGKIPKRIGELKALESLDLSRNHLSGEIPQSLPDVSFLNDLDLSDNNFSGRIPLGTQLQSLDASRFMGNQQLCGLPLLNQCPGDEAMPKPPNSGGDEYIQKDRQWLGISWSYASLALGFTFGFWGVCGTLLLNRSWRHAYFQFLNDRWECFYVIIAVNMTKLRRRL